MREFPKRCVGNPTGLPGVCPVVSHTNTVNNVLWALRERVLGTVVEGAWAPTWRSPELFATKNMRTIRRRVCDLVGFVSPISHSEYCEKYAGLRKKAYENARKSLAFKSIDWRDSHLNCFLKAEKWGEAKAPRMISPRSVRFLLAMGVYISPLEHRIYRAFKQYIGSPVIMKGLDQEARAEVAVAHWMAFGDPVAIGLDASKFDQHTSKKALQFEHGFYLRPHANDPDLARMCDWQLRNRCYATCEDGRVAWVTEGGRMSGDVNTALGNCILSATMLIAYCQERGIEARYMVDGDDCLVFMERSDVRTFMSGLTRWYKARGYLMKVEGPYEELHELEFCQSKLMHVSGKPLFVRNPFKAINQDHTWIVKGGMTHAEVLTATGLGGMSLYGDIPVLGAYYRMLAGDRQLSSQVLKRLDLRSSWLRLAKIGEGKLYSRPTTESRIEFFRTFGVHAVDQVILEDIYLNSKVSTTLPGDPNQIISTEQISASYRLTFLNAQ